MLSELLALSGAFLISLGVILVRRGLEESNFLTATVTITLIGTIVFCIISLLFIQLNNMNSLGIVFFILAGLFAPGFMRLTYYKGMEILGASLNASVFAVYPFFSSLLAVLFLGEHPSLGIWIGMICIISGVVLIQRNPTPGKSVKSTRISLAFPLSAALLYGFGLVLRKMGLNAYNEPIIGVTIAYLSALCLYILILAISPAIRKSISLDRKCLQLFFGAGLLICTGLLCSYYALKYGEVSIAAPIMSIEPFFVFVFSYVFIRKLEKITYKLVIGALIIFFGVSLITIF